MTKKRVLAALGCVGIAVSGGGCRLEDDPTGSLARAIGAPEQGRPSYIERLSFYASNRARMDPSATGWPSYPPVPPLLWRDELAQSSRAHSQDMHDNGCFQHPSCDGTDPFKRIQTYWTSPFTSMAENIAAGTTDGQEVIQNWIDEVGASPGETGHRDNLFDKAHSSHYVGLGCTAGGQQFQGYWTQDFTSVDPPPAIPRLPSGSHFPLSVAAGGSITFGAVYYDAQGKAPTRVEVVIDGKPTALVLQRGGAAAGAYEGAAAIAQGCHRYYFRAVVGGSVSAYPDTGTLGVASSGAQANCADYAPGGVSLTSDGGGGSADLGARHDLARHGDLATKGPPDLSGGETTDDAGSDDSGADSVGDTGGCSVALHRRRAPLAALGVGALLLFFRLRRRRPR